MAEFVIYPGTLQLSYRMSHPIEPVFHSHALYELYFFHEGRCNYLIGDRIHVLSPGDVILMNGMTLHCAKIDPSVTYVRSTIHFDPHSLAPLLAPFEPLEVLQPFQELGNYRFSLQGEALAEMNRLLARMQELKEQQDAVGEARLKLALADLLFAVYEHCQSPLKDKRELPSDKEKTVQRMISYLDRHYMDDFHLDELQEHLHMSKYYLVKMFKEITGVTIFDFLYQRRINQAKIHFLMDSQLSVTEVCFRVGFKHLAHFSRVFKKQVGSTPERFKREARSNGDVLTKPE
ncbi:helix-turn-helix transcriptional regulator [Paenibacillus sp. y28]|uniref:helix-turn-helix transcriptional regulator n=1 Tax=Paenibacillus sp. y28 TaxID=3129110 RepID=UPI003018686B